MKQRAATAKLVGVSKHFDGMPVLSHASLELFHSEILGLVGPNGSGKTTLINILCGVVKPDEGEFWIGDAVRSFGSPLEALALGVRLLPQVLDVYPPLNVLENIFVGQEITKGPRPFKMMAWSSMKAKAKALLDSVGAGTIDASRPIAELSGGQQKAVALARLLASDGQILVFDEPTTALGVEQKTLLLDVMRTQAKAGRAIIFISHDIDDLLAVCHRIVGLRNGRIDMDLRRQDIDRATLVLQMSAA
jgi:ABC-type sugar transport system ATPase subunit